MERLSEREVRRRMEEILAEQLARPSLSPSTRLEDEAEAFAQETPQMVERSRKRELETVGRDR